MPDPKVTMGTTGATGTTPLKRSSNALETSIPGPADERSTPPPATEAPTQSRLGRRLGEEAARERVRTTGHRHAQVVARGHPAKSKDVAPLEQALELRGKETITVEAYEANLEHTLAPLSKMLSQGVPDQRRWNRGTWNAFRDYCELVSKDPALKKSVADSLSQGASLEQVIEGLVRTMQAESESSGGLKTAAQLLRSVVTKRVDKETLLGLISARSFAERASSAYLAELSPEERLAYAESIHTTYLESQAPRFKSTSTLCAVGPGGTLFGRDEHGEPVTEETMLRLLGRTARKRHTDRTSPENAGTPKSLAKVWLSDFFEIDGSKITDEAASLEKALRFFTLAGKDVDAPSTDLGGSTIRAYLARKANESPAEYLDRLKEHQVFNPFIQPWGHLVEQAKSLPEPARTKQLDFLFERQEQALTASLVMMNTESLFARAVAEGVHKEDYVEKLDRAADVVWRVMNPSFDFDYPLIKKGFGSANGDDGIGQANKEKSRAAWLAVANVAKTRYLVGVADSSYQARFGGLLSETGSRLVQQGVATHLQRLFRDVGKDHPPLRKVLTALDFGQDEKALMSKLQRLRFDPEMYSIANPGGGPARVRMGDAVLEFAKINTAGEPMPEFVAGTHLGFAVKVVKGGRGFAEGETALLRLPKGGQFELDPTGTLHAKVHDEARYTENRGRIQEHTLIADRYGIKLPTRFSTEVQGDLPMLLESLDRQSRNAAVALAKDSSAPKKLSAKNVDYLVDLYLRGLTETDEAHGRKYGVLYELGLHNVAFDADGSLGHTYLDACFLYRTARDREEYGFFSGGYGGAAAWIRGDARPLGRDEIDAVWNGKDLDPEQRRRRDLFIDALRARLDPSHPVYQSMPKGAFEKIKPGLSNELKIVEHAIAKKETSAKTGAASKTAASTPATPAIPKPGVPSAQIARLGAVRTLSAAKMEGPVPRAGVILRDHVVIARIDGKEVEATLAGHDRHDRPVIFLDGQRRVLSWDDLRAKDPDAPYVPAFAKLPEGAIVAADDRQKGIMRSVLHKKVVGTHAVDEYVGWLHKNGEEAYLVGGLVRELVRGTSPKKRETDAEIMKKLNDVDLASTATPDVGRKMMREVAPEIPSGGVSAGLDQWGTLVSGNLSEGLDFMSLASSGTCRAPVYDPHLDEIEVPSVFDHDLEADSVRRDFTCNALYYDPHNDAIIDPTGHGIADAQNNVLRLAAKGDRLDIPNDLVFRFWKFRGQGWSPESETLATMRKMANEQIGAMSVRDPAELALQMGKIVGAKGGDVAKNFAAIKGAIVDDGMGPLYDACIRPLESAILYKAKQFAARASKA